MIDLHLHVLPGIDDGASSFEEAEAMCRLAADDGVETLIVTPHQRTELWENRDPARLDALREELQERVGPRPLLLPGAEIRVDSELLVELADLPASGLVPLAGSRYLLLELDRHDRRVDAVGLAHELLVAGWVPVFAHPEVIPALYGSPATMERLAGMGALFQLTATSVTGEWGAAMLERAAAMLDAGLIHFVASDAHSTHWRPPGLGRAHRALAAGWGEQTAHELTTLNPAAVAQDRPLAARTAARSSSS